jgi:DNA-binding protein HU-beta
MTKQELIAQVAKKSGLTKADVERVLKALLDTIIRAAKKGDRVTLVGFGSFFRQKRAARKGVNPKTGEAIRIRAKKVLKFKASSSVKL